MQSIQQVTDREVVTGQTQLTQHITEGQAIRRHTQPGRELLDVGEELGFE